jgi:hypothetical protein
MKTIQELESEVWKNIELSTKNRDSKKLAHFNEVALRIQRVKELIEGIENDIYLKNESDYLDLSSIHNEIYNVHDLPINGTECRFSYRGKQYDGIIKNGKLEIPSYGSFKSFSGASVKITKTNRNGWRDWELRIPGTAKWISAFSWRRMNNKKDD